MTTTTAFQSLFALLIACAVALGATTPGQAQDTTTDKRFEQMLGAVDVVPTRAQLDANWTHADQRLMQAATDPTRDIWRRARALSLLSFYPTDTTRAFLLRMMDLNVEPRLRQVATYTLGLTFGTPGDPELVAQMVTMTQDPDDKVRRRAVRTLRWIDHPNAEDALKAIAKGSADDELSKLAAYVLQRRHDRLGK